MVLVLIGIIVGIIIVTILIVKAAKTHSKEVVGMDIFCRKCGVKTNGLKCPRCEKTSQSFGV
jgi:rubrerythrin